MATKCGANKKSGEGTCGQAAGWGTNHPGVGRCKVHGGKTRNHEVHGARILADMQLRKDLAKFAHPINISPEQALLSLVREAAGNVAYLGARIDTLLNPPPAMTIAGGGLAGQHWEAGYDKGDQLFGPELMLDREGREHVVGEQYRGMVALYNEERDRLLAVSKAAIAAGIAKAQVEIAQQQAQTIALILNRVMEQMGLDEAKRIMARHLLGQELRSAGQQEAMAAR